MSLRACVTCGKLSIESNRPDYVKQCTDCYKNYKNSMRECSVCFQKKIPSNLPEYMKKCKMCYSAGVNGGNSSNSNSNSNSNPVQETISFITSSTSNDVVGGRQCVDCKKPNISAASANYVVRCNTCYQRKTYKESGGILDL